MTGPAPMPLAVCAIAAATLFGVVVRPFRVPEAAWAAAGAVALVAFGLVPGSRALHAVGDGTDVYLFLVGMMLLSALAEREGLFDHLAAVCVRRARGSSHRLFALVYGVGIVVTVFMSNDATAVVLTPAVLAVCRKAQAKPLPYLLACALIANAASFVLPISNPANLVVFADRMPSLGAWLARFALPSMLSVAITYAVLVARSHRELSLGVASDVAVPPLSNGGRLAATGVGVVAVVLLAASARGADLGAPTLVAASLAWLGIAVAKRESPWPVLEHVAWSIVPLVAGLFVVVEALRGIGLLEALTHGLQALAARSPVEAALGAGTLVALASNLTNNLPAGLVAGAVAAAARVDPVVHAAVAIGIDLGPNLSVTGSLATILWLQQLRRRGERVDAWTFLKTGAVAMPAALAGALGALVAQARLG